MNVRAFIITLLWGASALAAETVRPPLVECNPPLRAKLPEILKGAGVPSSWAESEPRRRSTAIEDALDFGDSVLREETGYVGSPSKSKEFGIFFEEALGLGPEDRARVLGRLKAMSAPAGGVAFPERSPRFLLRLALYDEAAWMGFVKLVSEADILALPSQVGFYQRLLDGMPPELARKVVAAFAARYDSLEKNVRALQMAPKRFVDALVAGILKPERYFERARAEGRSVTEALDDYIQATGSLPRGQEGVGAGGYGSQEILAVAKVVQKELRAAHLPEGTKVTLVGSFPNGKAKLASSDIDVLSSEKRFYPKLLSLNGEVNEAVKALGIKKSRLHLEEAPKVGDEFYRISSRVQVEIEAGVIRVKVYPAGYAKSSLDWPEPLVYVLEQ